jgi:NADH-quinone oxidoreductase subunit N
MLTSLAMLYGMSFLFGVTGTTRFDAFDLSGAGTLGLLAVVLTFVGLFAKLSAAPFHYWAPDAYEGAEAWAVAFVSTVPKLAGAVAIVRLTAAIAPTAPAIGPAMVAVAAASMLLGNLAALTQTDLRRMMAYSGVAHTGYLLLGAGALTAAGLGSAIFYALAYALPSLGVMLVAAEEGPALDDVGGLVTRRPAAAWAVVAMLISLIGIPPFVGFFGKLYLFSAALGSGLVWWVVLALVMSVVSAGYYLRIVRSMFFGESAESEGPAAARVWPAAIAVAATALLTLALGIAAGPLLAALGSPLP